LKRTKNSDEKDGYKAMLNTLQSSFNDQIMSLTKNEYPEATRLIYDCLDYDPTKRPNARSLLNRIKIVEGAKEEELPF
jgi:hypothetical protein